MFAGLLLRRRVVAPAEGTFDVSARARVEPQGVAPSGVASGTATVTAIARVEPVGDIPPVPDAPTNNAVSMEPFFNVFVVRQSWDNNDPGNTDTIRVQEATNVGFTENLDEKELSASADDTTWEDHEDGITRYYRVHAENGSGPSAWSNVDSVVHPVEDPGAVENFDGAAASMTAMSLSWDAPASGGPVDHYEIETLERGDEGTTAGTSDTVTGLDPVTAYGFRVRAIGPTGAEGQWTSYIFRATRHPTPGLEGCVNTPDPSKPNITEDRLLITDNASENTNIRVERNGALYDLIGDGSQGYTPASQSGSWRVVATGGTTNHATGGAVSIPDSANSPTRSMPFSSPCEPV